jgi:hypothetical protein
MATRSPFRANNKRAPHFSVQLSKVDQKKRKTLAIYYLSRIEQHKKEKNN